MWLYQNTFFIRFTFLILFLVLVNNCQFLDKVGKPSVPLNWPSGDIAFMSNRITPNRNQIGWDGPLYLVNINDKNWGPIQNSYTNSHLGNTPSWSPDGQMLAFVGYPRKLNGHRGVLLLDAQGNRSIFGDNSRLAATWSPDGQYLAYYAEEGEYSLRVSRPDGSEEQEIITNLPRELFHKPNLVQDIRIAWSPDGQHIAYDNFDASGNEAIWIVASKGGQPYQIVTGGHPAWSPLEDEIAFDRDGTIWIINLETQAEELLVRAAHESWVYDGWATWSPDAQRLAFVGSWEGNAEIYLINRDGSGLENLTNHPSHDAFPAWRPVLQE